MKDVDAGFRGAEGPLFTDWKPEAVRRRWDGRSGRFAGDGVTRLLLRLSRKYIGQTVLDVGAGAEGPMRLLPRAVGLDLAPRQPGTVAGDMCSMPFRDEAFDTLFSIEVLEHLPGDRLVRGLQEIHRVLKPGGHVVVVTPDREDLSQRETVCPQCGTKYHWLGHVRSFDAESLASILRSVGLESVMWRTLPLGFRGQHRVLGRLAFLLPLLGLRLPGSLMVVARRPS